MYHVYIIYSSSFKKFYIGYTTDLKARILKHNSGGSKFTRKNRPWVLAHYQAFLEKQDAIDEEIFLKTGQGRERRKYLLKSFLKNNL